MLSGVRTAVRALAATGLVAAGLVVSAPPASAALCGSADGISVVVDFKALQGGSPAQSCVPDNGTAARHFQDAGHVLTQVQRQPGFVCRVDGLPSAQQEACVQTPPANRYWSLWVSDGTSGTWTYASLGAYSLQVPEGGAVAFSWNTGGDRDQPGVTPPVHGSGGSGGSGGGDGGSAGSGGDGGSGGDRGGNGAADAGRDDRPSAGPDGSAGPAGDPSAAPDEDREARGDRADADPDRGDRDGRDRDRGDRDRRDEDGRDRDDRDRDDRDRDADEATPAAGDSPSVAPEGSQVTTDPVSADSQGLPSWVVPGALLVLLGGGAATAYARRRTSRHG